MTYTQNPPSNPHTGPSAPHLSGANSHKKKRTLWLAIGIPVGLILLFGSIAAWFALSPGNTVDESATLADAQSVSVTASNATLDFLPSTDDQIDVRMSGTHTGPAPTLNAQVEDGVAHVNVECPRVWFFTPPCDLSVTVALPPNLDVSADGVNGRITLNDLTGDIRLETTNGSIYTTGTSGQLDLVTVNGSITAQNAASDTVNTETVNGTVELTFRMAPSAVTATSTNGAVTVRVPDDGTPYAMNSTTVLGKVDTANVPTDPAAENTITAETVNGSITVTTGP